MQLSSAPGGNNTVNRSDETSGWLYTEEGQFWLRWRSRTIAASTAGHYVFSLKDQLYCQREEHLYTETCVHTENPFRPLETGDSYRGVGGVRPDAEGRMPVW